jgi:hypothetical protein
VAEQWSTCPFCGLHLVRDDARATIAHQAPECAEFTALCKRSAKSGQVVAIERRDEAGRVVQRTVLS